MNNNKVVGCSQPHRQLKVLFEKDENILPPFKLRSSTYCDRIKQLRQISYAPKKQRKSFIMCLGETTRLNNFQMKPKPKLQIKLHTRHKTLQNEPTFNLELTPWEIQSPRI